uniref:Uncharacterized protein n=1 Tax=Anguilla anguilla TaxID=7936 RepID=A0A0E9S8K1_ANGAN
MSSTVPHCCSASMLIT